MSSKNARMKMKMRCDIERSNSGEGEDIYGRPTSTPRGSIVARGVPCLIWISEGSNPIVTPDKQAVVTMFRGLFSVTTDVKELDCLVNVRDRMERELFDGIKFRVNYCPPVFGDFITLSLETVT